jgi:hypothetical protein
VASHRLRNVLGLGPADAQLDGGVAVLLGRTDGHDLAVLDLKDCDADMAAVDAEEPGHADLLGKEARAHRRRS